MKLTFSASQLMQTMEKTRRAWGRGEGGASTQACAAPRNESETDIKLILN